MGQSARLEKSVENVLSQYEEDEREQEVQSLMQSNAELVDTNDQLR